MRGRLATVLVRLLEPLRRQQRAEVEIPLTLDDDLAAATVHGRTRLHDDVLTPALLVGVLADAEPADDPPAVQRLVVPAVLPDEVLLLVDEVSVDEELPREVVVPSQLRLRALDTAPVAVSVRVCHGRLAFC